MAGRDRQLLTIALDIRRLPAVLPASLLNQRGVKSEGIMLVLAGGGDL